MLELIILLVCTNLAVAGFAVQRGIKDARTILTLVEGIERAERHCDTLYLRLYHVTKRHTHVGTFAEFRDVAQKEIET